MTGEQRLPGLKCFELTGHRLMHWLSKVSGSTAVAPAPLMWILATCVGS